MLLNLFLAYPYLIAALNVGAAFYGSIVTFTFNIFGPRYFHLTSTIGAVSGYIALNAALGLLMTNAAENINGADFSFFEQNYGGLVGVSFAAVFWPTLIFGCWFFRDRFRGGQYGTLEHSYREAAADGMMIVNFPLTCGIAGMIGMLIQSVSKTFFG